VSSISGMSDVRRTAQLMCGARACLALTLAFCWALSSSKMRKERALMKVCDRNLKVMTSLT
jgi:hypothetical protein